MGVVIRQGIKSTAVQYVGVVVGVVANLFLYTQLDTEYGLIQTMIAAASTLLPFAMLGSYSLAVRYYPEFSNEEKNKRGFLGLLLLVAFGGVLLYLAISPFLQDLLLNHFFEKTPDEYKGYISYLPVLVVAMVFTKVIAQYISNFRRIVIPTLLEQFLFKLTLPSLLLLYLLKVISLESVVIGTLVHFVFVAIAMTYYLFSLGELNVGKPTAAVTDKWKGMASFGSYGIAGMLGRSLAFRIDVLMVAAYLDFAAAGQYAIALFMSEVIAKPYTNLASVVGPQISEAWAKDDKDTIRRLYRRACDNMVLVCGYLFGGIIVCFASIAQIAANPEVLSGAFTAFFFLGLARWIDASTSMNEHVITYSKKYQFNLIAILILAVVGILLNIWLVPAYGVMGAGLATLISLTLYNVAKVLFAGFSFGIWPFGKTTYEISAVMVTFTVIVFFMPTLDIWWLDILWRGGLLTVLVAGYAWFRAPSPEAKKLMKSLVGKVFSTKS
ncbi:MAG: polysaccharide biosynthesis C-terminal domain-containing protein [Saprospiraceae bacterium]